MKRRSLLGAAFGSLLPAALISDGAVAQSYPSKPIRIITPVVAGGAPDIRVRQIAPKLAESLGQPVIVENRPGANGQIGAREVARAAPDGYTLFNANISNALNDALAADPATELTRAFVPVTDIAASPLIMVANPGVPAATLKEFVALAKAKPGGYTYASGGSGSVIQLTGERLKLAAGIDVREVPYKSLGADLNDLLAGHVNTGFAVSVTLNQHIKSGKLRAYGVAGPRRLAVLPDVPTMAEAGAPEVEAIVWNGIFVPAGTSPAIVATLHREIAKALASPDVRDQIIASGSEVGGSPPEQFAAFIRREAANWSRVVKDAGIKLQGN